MKITENRIGKIRANKITLSEEQIRSYHGNGYLIVPGVVEEETCETIKRMAEPMADQKLYHALLNIHRRIDFFWEIAKDPVLVSLVKTLQRHKVVVLNDQYFFKKAGTPYAKQAWSPHQDIAYIGARPGTYIQVHLFLTQSDKENGGLYYYPGSHKESILPCECRKSWKEEFDESGVSHPGWVIKQIPSQYKKIDIVGPKGGICFQHGNVIHGSYPNLTPDRSREQYSIAYLNEGEKFLHQGHSSIKIPVEVENDRHW